MRADAFLLIRFSFWKQFSHNQIKGSPLGGDRLVMMDIYFIDTLVCDMTANVAWQPDLHQSRYDVAMSD